MGDWSKYADEMLRVRNKNLAIELREGATEVKDSESSSREGVYALSDDGRNLLVDHEKVLGFSQKLISLLEARARRAWAAKIREEFGKYHDHSGGGECGACGAIQAADFMDPDAER